VIRFARPPHYSGRTNQIAPPMGVYMSVGLDNLKHIVVLMMENRSFDHMLGGLSSMLGDS
jgi:phospholipase C